MNTEGRWVIYCEERPLESRRPLTEQELQFLTRRHRGGWSGVLAFVVLTVLAAAGVFALNAVWLMVVAMAFAASAILLARDLVRGFSAVRRVGRESEVLVFAAQDADEEPLAVVFPPGIPLPDMDDEHATMEAAKNLYRLAAPPDDLLIAKAERRQLLPSERTELARLVVRLSRIDWPRALASAYFCAAAVAGAWNLNPLVGQMLVVGVTVLWLREWCKHRERRAALRLDSEEGIVEGWVARLNLDPSVTWWMESLLHSREPWTSDGIPHPRRWVRKLTVLPGHDAGGAPD